MRHATEQALALVGLLLFLAAALFSELWIP
jgi:hypothetical protein